MEKILHQKYSVKYCAGNFLLVDIPYLGRPVEVDNDQTITLVENNQCYTRHTIGWYTTSKVMLQIWWD